MEFKSFEEAAQRIRENRSLTSDEMRAAKPWLGPLGPAMQEIFKTELVISTIEAIQRFEVSSSRLTRWLIRLTLALVALTVVLAIPIAYDALAWWLRRGG